MVVLTAAAALCASPSPARSVRSRPRLIASTACATEGRAAGRNGPAGGPTISSSRSTGVRPRVAPTFAAEVPDEGGDGVGFSASTPAVLTGTKAGVTTREETPTARPVVVVATGGVAGPRVVGMSRGNCRPPAPVSASAPAPPPKPRPTIGVV